MSWYWPGTDLEWYRPANDQGSLHPFMGSYWRSFGYPGASSQTSTQYFKSGEYYSGGYVVDSPKYMLRKQCELASTSSSSSSSNYGPAFYFPNNDTYLAYRPKAGASMYDTIQAGNYGSTPMDQVTDGTNYYIRSGTGLAYQVLWFDVGTSEIVF